MKKQILAVVLISGLAIATAASANWGRGGGFNAGYCPQAQNMQQLDPAVQQKFDAFTTDSQALRKEIAVKRAEKMALMRNDNPDPAAVAKLTGELFDLQASMRDKATAAGVDQYMGPRGGGCGMGQGMGGCGGGGGRGGRMMRGGPNF
jgi:Skp family chaperone for outer membrane proteins